MLAIATSHTVHIAVLPDSSLLGQVPNKAIKLKTYTVGPTSHVLSQGQVTNILWHPYGVAGNCLVTVTVDAIVRLWEFSQDNRWSFDSPALAVDLKKLMTGTSEEEDFAPDKFGINRKYTSDALGLEIASANFGGSGLSDESAWSAMTLWLATKGGDVYALCPLLPSIWEPFSTLIPALTGSVVEKSASTPNEDEKDTLESRQCRDQYGWIRSLDNQEPILDGGEDGTRIEVYKRPIHPGPIPRLQGPFQMFSDELDEDLEFSDIYVIPGKSNPKEFLDDDDDDLDSETEYLDDHGIPTSVICLVTRSGRVYVCLDLEGVEGQWLPRKKVSLLSSMGPFFVSTTPNSIPSQPNILLPPSDDPYLVTVEALDTLRSSESLDLEWPTFTADLNSRYSFFITHSRGVFSFSLDPWVWSLEKELQSSEIIGAKFRMETIRNGPKTTRDKILAYEPDRDTESDPSVTACLVFQDSDLGYLLLTAVNGAAQAATLDQPDPEITSAPEDNGNDAYIPEMNLFTPGPPRKTYEPAQVFFDKSSLPAFIKKHVPERHHRMFNQEIRLSSATLDFMTQAHRVLSSETNKLELAAADLFRRCERLQDELRDQINRANEVARRTDQVTGKDLGQYLDSGRRKGHLSVEERFKKVRSKQEELTARYEALRKKFSKHGGNELSDKEKQWILEVEKTKEFIKSPPAEDDEKGEEASEAWRRFREASCYLLSVQCLDKRLTKAQAQELAEDLIAQAKETSQDAYSTNDEDTHVIPPDLRKAKTAQVMKLLDREYVNLLVSTLSIYNSSC